jgi:hypothetical protein
LHFGQQPAILGPNSEAEPPIALEQGPTMKTGIDAYCFLLIDENNYQTFSDTQLAR